MRRTALLVFLALALAACQPAPKPDPAAMSVNRAVFEQIRTGQEQSTLAQLTPEAQRDAKAALDRLRALLPPGKPLSVTPVGATFAQGPAGRIQVLAVEYDFPDRTVQFTTTLAQPNGAKDWKLASFRLVERTHKELHPNTLSLTGRSIGQLAFFALAFTSPILMLAALVKVLRTPNLPNRWLLAAVSLIGLFSFQMNWATGSVLVGWMSLQIVGFWLTKAPSQFSPWLISASIPIGALLILGGLVAKPPPASGSTSA